RVWQHFVGPNKLELDIADSRASGSGAEIGLKGKKDDIAEPAVSGMEIGRRSDAQAAGRGFRPTVTMGKPVPIGSASDVPKNFLTAEKRVGWLLPVTPIDAPLYGRVFGAP